MADAGGAPFTDVNTLPIVPDDVALKIKQAAHLTLGPDKPPLQDAVMPDVTTKPGVERWPVKTGQDPDRGLVGKNVIDGQDLGAGIVVTTVEEMITAPRPADMPDPTKIYDTYQSRRAAPVETTVWRIDARITAIKLEADGDYHLVLQGASGEMMIGEIPTPTTQFVGDSPWIANIQAARKAVDDKLVHPLAQQTFIKLNGKTVPSASLASPSAAPAAAPAPTTTPIPLPGS